MAVYYVLLYTAATYFITYGFELIILLILHY